MQPSAFSHEGSGTGQHNFYGQPSAYGGATGGSAVGGHHNPHGSYGQHSGYPPHGGHGEQSPSMSYLQPGGQHTGHMAMYQNYPQHYAAHGPHASAQQQGHYSHVPAAAFAGVGGPNSNASSMLAGNGASDFHPGAGYSHLGHHAMYYQDPSGAGGVHGMMHHHGVPGMIPPVGTVPGAGAYNPMGHHTGAQGTAIIGKGSGKGGKAGANAAIAATGGRKGSSAGHSKKAGAKAAKEDATADVGAGGKAKNFKSGGVGDRHHPYAGGEAASEKPKKKEKEPPKPSVLKSHLKPPKQAPSAWQVYFTEELQKIKAEQPGARLNVAHVAKDAGQRYAALPEEKKQEFQRRSQEAKEQWERDMLAWKSTLTPEDIKQENMFRTAQRKAGKSRKGNLKDPNAPKKPLSAYFLFLRAIRADPKMTEDVFHGEQETTKQSVLAAAKWRSLPEEEKQPFLEKAEADKVEYERLRKDYEQSHGLTSLGGDGAKGEDEDDFEYGDDGAEDPSATEDATRWAAQPARGQPVPPSLAAGGDEPFKLDGHFGLGEDADLGFAPSKVESGFGLET